MKPLKQKLRQLLPRRIRRALSEKDAGLSSRVHTDPQLAAAALGFVDGEWRARIDAVISCSDNTFIERCVDAGKLEDGFITMHNGIRVGALGYYGGGIMNMLVENGGVHEPQEERAYSEVLKHVSKGSTILELGAYWGFYSMWFLSEVRNGKAILVEPNPQHILSGKSNFKMNGMTAAFESAYVGNSTKIAKDGTPTTTVDELFSRHQIERLAILHSDIQGAELEMLEGARNSLTAGLIDYVFISTHSEALHIQCLDFLEKLSFYILVSCDMKHTVSVDGVIVARRSGIQMPTQIEVEGNSIQAIP